MEEAGVPRYFRAIKARQGNLEALDFQYSKGLVYIYISIFLLKNIRKISEGYKDIYN